MLTYVAFGSIGALVVMAFFVLRHQADSLQQSRAADPRPVVRRLTANPAGRPMRSAVIAPDGRYLAYADPTGIQIRHIDSGQTFRLANTAGMDVYGWSDDSTKVRASDCTNADCTGWAISLVGEVRTPFDGHWPNGEFFCPVAGSTARLRYVRPLEQLRIDRGEGATQLVTGIKQFSCRASGGKLYVSRDFRRIDSIPIARSEAPHQVWSAPEGTHLDDVLGLSDGRALVSLESRDGTALLELGPSASGETLEVVRRWTDWRQDRMTWLSASNDGKRVTYIRLSTQADTYVADLVKRATSLSAPRRLTFDDRDDEAYSWSDDSESVFFASDRNGDFDVFRQKTSNETAEPIIVQRGMQWAPVESGDRKWLLFAEVLTDSKGEYILNQNGDLSGRLMRIPIAGGAQEPLGVDVTNRVVYGAFGWDPVSQLTMTPCGHSTRPWKRT